MEQQHLILEIELPVAFLVSKQLLPEGAWGYQMQYFHSDGLRYQHNFKLSADDLKTLGKEGAEINRGVVNICNLVRKNMKPETFNHNQEEMKNQLKQRMESMSKEGVANGEASGAMPSEDDSTKEQMQ